MYGYPPALRRTGFVAPRAIGRFGEAILEARAADGDREHRHVHYPRPPRPVSRRDLQAWGPTPVEPRHRPVIRLWLPSTLIFLLLAPFALLLAPLLYLAPPPYGVRPFATIVGLGSVLLSLGGTEVDVDAPDALVRIRLF